MFRGTVLSLMAFGTIASASPAQIADALAQKLGAVRAPCPTGLNFTAECFTADMSVDPTRLFINTSISNTQIEPWKQGNGTVTTRVRDDDAEAVIMLTGKDFKTLVLVYTPPTVAQAAPVPQPLGKVKAVDLRNQGVFFHFRFTNKGPTLTRLDKTTPIFFKGERFYVSFDAIKTLGCEINELSTAIVRVACVFPNIGKVYEDLPFTTP